MDKPHAIRLADALDQFHNPWDKEAADELRRLHQSEQEGWRWAKECEAEVKKLKELAEYRLQLLTKMPEQDPMTTVQQLLAEANGYLAKMAEIENKEKTLESMGKFNR